MKRYMTRLVLFASAVLLVPCLVGCPGKKEKEFPQEIMEKVRIAISGSDATYAILKSLSAQYSKTHPQLSFDFLPSSHTGGGVQGAYNREIDLGATSRAPLKDEEKYGLVYYEFARDGLPFVVNQNIPLANVTARQIKEIYAGKITKWSQLGVKGLGNDDIIVIDRPAHSSARMVLDEVLFKKDFKFGPNLVMVERASDAVDALAKTPNAIGYTSQQAVIQGKLPLKLLAVDGIEPTFDNIKNGKFVYMRPFGVVHRPDAKQEVKDFVAFIKTQEGRKIIQDEALIPMP